MSVWAVGASSASNSSASEAPQGVRALPAPAGRHVLAEAAASPFRVEGRHPWPHGIAPLRAVRSDHMVNRAVAAIASDVSVATIQGAPCPVVSPFADIARRVDMLRIDVVA